MRETTRCHDSVENYRVEARSSTRLEGQRSVAGEGGWLVLLVGQEEY